MVTGRANRCYYRTEIIRGILNLADVEVVYGPPTAEEFVHLRQIARLRERTIASAEKGLINSLFWVTLRKEAQLIGMGRVVGDGGTVAQITDMAVAPRSETGNLGVDQASLLSRFRM